MRAPLAWSHARPEPQPVASHDAAQVPPHLPAAQLVQAVALPLASHVTDPVQLAMLQLPLQVEPQCPEVQPPAHDVVAPVVWLQLAVPVQKPWVQLAPQVAPHLPAAHPVHALAVPLALSHETVPVHEPWAQLDAHVGPHLPAAHVPEHDVATPLSLSQLMVPPHDPAAQLSRRSAPSSPARTRCTTAQHHSPGHTRRCRCSDRWYRSCCTGRPTARPRIRCSSCARRSAGRRSPARCSPRCRSSSRRCRPVTGVAAGARDGRAAVAFARHLAAARRDRAGAVAGRPQRPGSHVWHTLAAPFACSHVTVPWQPAWLHVWLQVAPQ